jgi:hypothetical protein
LSIPVLCTLLNALKSDECKFVAIPDTVLKARKAAYEADIAAGRIEGKHRNPRSDNGKKRSRAGSDGVDDDQGNNDHVADTVAPQYSVEEPDNSMRPTKRRKAAANPPQKVAALQAKSATLRCLKAGTGPGSAVGRAYKSRVIISDDEDSDEAPTGASAHMGLSAEERTEMELDPDADNDGPSSSSDLTPPSLTPAVTT